MSKSISKQSNRKKVRFPYTIIIPSTQKPEQLQSHTLTLLHAFRIPASAILIAVPSSEEETLYKECISSNLYGRILAIHAPLPSAEFYNRLSELFPEGIPLVYMSDSLTGIVQKEPYVTHPLVPVRQLCTLFKHAFDLCQTHHSQLWGLYPVANGHFMNSSVSTQLKYIPGGMWGCFNPGSATIKLHTNTFVDYERSILYWKTFGSIVRLNWISVLDSGTYPRIANRPAKQLAKLYPDVVRLEQTDSGETQIRLYSPP